MDTDSKRADWKTILAIVIPTGFSLLGGAWAGAKAISDLSREQQLQSSQIDAANKAFAAAIAEIKETYARDQDDRKDRRAAIMPQIERIRIIDSELSATKEAIRQGDARQDRLADAITELRGAIAQVNTNVMVLTQRLESALQLPPRSSPTGR